MKRRAPAPRGPRSAAGEALRRAARRKAEDAVELLSDLLDDDLGRSVAEGLITVDDFDKHQKSAAGEDKEDSLRTLHDSRWISTLPSARFLPRSRAPAPSSTLYFLHAPSPSHGRHSDRTYVPPEHPGFWVRSAMPTSHCGMGNSKLKPEMSASSTSTRSRATPSIYCSNRFRSGQR